MKQICKLKCQKMAIFSIFKDFNTFGNFPQMFAIFRQQKKISKHDFDLVSFFLSIFLLSTAGEK